MAGRACAASARRGRRSRTGFARRWLGVVAAVALLGGCVTIPRDSFTAAERAAAMPASFADARLPSDDSAIAAAMQEALARRQVRDPREALTLLALSGGGANGAYGAGVLYGWSETGKRPRFSVVTGVSTGALIAPFAFLGSAWDGELRHAFTDGRASKLLPFPGLRVLTSDSIYSGKPLRRLIASCVTDRMMAAIAQENERGRQLLIATTDLDAQRIVIWDMGAIAHHGGPAARALFIDVLTASASIPGVFPPTLIATRTGQRVIREMHVDGTTINAFFAIPDAALLLDGAQRIPGGAFYVLINGKADPEFKVTKDSLLSIVERSYFTATTASQRTALVAVAAFGRDKGVETYVSAIPPATVASSLDFRQKSMIALFDLGRARAGSGTAWRDLQAALLDR